MQIPEVLQNNWLLVVLFALFVGPQALFSRNNAENLWLFGWIYRRIKDRKINALKDDDRIDDVVRESLESEIRYLQTRIRMQADWFTQEVAEKENSLRDARQEITELRAYVVALKRWALDRSESDGDLPLGFDAWRKEKSAKRRDQGEDSV